MLIDGDHDTYSLVPIPLGTTTSHPHACKGVCGREREDRKLYNFLIFRSGHCRSVLHRIQNLTDRLLDRIWRPLSVTDILKFGKHRKRLLYNLQFTQMDERDITVLSSGVPCPILPRTASSEERDARSKNAITTCYYPSATRTPCRRGKVREYANTITFSSPKAKGFIRGDDDLRNIS